MKPDPGQIAFDAVMKAFQVHKKHKISPDVQSSIANDVGFKVREALKGGSNDYRGNDG